MPGLDATTASQVRSVLNDEAMVTKQVIGLMVANQFIPTGSGVTTAVDPRSGAAASAGELLSNQVNNWLSQISKDVTLGIDYKAKDELGREEWDLLYGKTLFNDRLNIEGNVGVMTDQTTRNVVGDFNAEYTVGADGRFKLKAFNRSNASNLLNYNAPYTQGVGFFYREQFSSFRQLFERHSLAKKDTTLLP
jgi:hypothetical protein